MPSENARAATKTLLQAALIDMRGNRAQTVDMVAAIIDQQFPNADLNLQYVQQTSQALMWMHYDKSLNLTLGGRLNVEGVAALKEQRDRFRKENDLLRGLLPKMPGAKCPYCALESMADCKSGFPGCAWADDLMCGEDEVLGRLLKDLKQANQIIGNQAGEAKWMQARIDVLEGKG